MKSSMEAAVRWLRQAEETLDYRGDRYVVGDSLIGLLSDLEGGYPEMLAHSGQARVLDRHYIPTRYPDVWPDNVPFESYDRNDAAGAVEAADEIVQMVGGLVAD